MFSCIRRQNFSLTIPNFILGDSINTWTKVQKIAGISTLLCPGVNLCCAFFVFQLQPNSASGSGALEHDYSCLFTYDEKVKMSSISQRMLVVSTGASHEYLFKVEMKLFPELGGCPEWFLRREVPCKIPLDVFYPDSSNISPFTVCVNMQSFHFESWRLRVLIFNLQFLVYGVTWTSSSWRGCHRRLDQIIWSSVSTYCAETSQSTAQSFRDLH